MDKRFGLKTNCIKDIINVLKIQPEVEEALVFGSRAMGTYKNGSDIDIALKGEKITFDTLSTIRLHLDELPYLYMYDIIDYKKVSNPAVTAHIDELGITFYKKTEMPSEWKTYKLSEIAQMIGGGTPKTTVEEYWNGDIPWLSVVDFGKSVKTVYNTEKTITEKGLKESSTKILKKGQLIISARGTVGELAMLGRDMAFNQSCYGLNANKETTNEFLYYLVKESVGKIKQNTHGAVFDTITKQTFENIEVTIPSSIEEQTQIAQILTSLDDKIELNLQMNQTLEAMAQALFKEWFVNFNFPNFDGELENGLPKGWRMGKLGEIINVKNGFAFKGTDFINEGVPVLKIKNVKPNRILLNNLSFVSEETAKKAEKYYVEKNTLLITMSGNRIDGTPDTWVGKVALFNENKNYLLNQRLSALVLKKGFEHFLYYLTLLLSSEDFQYYFISNATSSGGQANISPTFINNSEIIIPSKELLRQYFEIVESIYKKTQENENQIQTLTQTRDTLLPKLMSGKIRLNRDLLD